jgi:molecular chaperone GrpE
LGRDTDLSDLIKKYIVWLAFHAVTEADLRFTAGSPQLRGKPMANGSEEDPQHMNDKASNPCIPESQSSTDPVLSPEHISVHSDSAPTPSELKNLHLNMTVIRELVEKRLSSDEVKDEAFHRLYEELDKIKQHTAVLDNKPLYIDIILLYDRMDAACEHARGEPSQVLSSLREEVKEILLRRSIHRISTGHEIFDPRTQRAVSTETCLSPEEDRKVLRVLREGFSCGELVIRPQEVVIARFNPKAPDAQPRDVPPKHEKA